MMHDAIEIVRSLQSSGHTAYFAGGYVRDMILGVESGDIDIATSAKPEDVEQIFEKTVPVGREFGVVRVIVDKNSYEVATFRKEADYIDNRRPGHVTYTSAEIDAQRRDFTVNGLFYDPIKKQIIDFVGGQEDIKKKTIRFIGDPAERIEEDHLRLVRAIRLRVALGFQYDKQTFEAVRKYSDLIRSVAAERIRDELNKIMASSNRAQGLIELSESSILKNIIPEIEKLKGVPQPLEYHHEGDVFTHTYLALKSLNDRAPTYLAWAVLLHDIAKPQTLIREGERIIFHDHAKQSAILASKILARLKFAHFELNDISWLIENHMKIGDINKMRPNKRLEFVLDPKFNDLISLTEADSNGTYPVNLSMVGKLKEDVDKALLWKKKNEVHAQNKFFSGDDLIKLGLEPGEKFKEILSDVEDLKIEGKIKTKQEAVQYLKNQNLL